MRVLVVGNIGAGGHSLYCRAVTDAIRSAGAEASLCGVELFPRPWYSRIAPLWAADRVTRTVRAAAHVRRAIKRFRPDVVHFQMTTPLVDRWWVPQLARRVATVATVHNVEPHRRGVESHPRMAKPLMEAFDALLVHSQGNRIQLRDKYPHLSQRIEVIPHGVWVPECSWTREQARTQLGLPADGRIVLFFGGIRRNKGLDLLLESLALLRGREGEQPPILLIAGGLPRGEDFSRYQERIDALELGSRVVVRLGFVAEEDVSAYFAASDLVALPYTPDFKAQSGVLVQAYGHGVPVVATEVGALGETLRSDGTGRAVPPQRPDEFAGALAELLHDETLRAACVGNMKRLMKSTYSWHHVGEMTLDAYRRVLVRRAGRQAA